MALPPPPTGPDEHDCDSPGTPAFDPAHDNAGKVRNLAELMALRQHARANGRAVVQCHGCFDIVHPGHIRHLRQAKAQGDILLVSITGDSSYSKRDGKALIPEDLRAEGLAALDFVDWVYIEQSATAEELLSRVQPDVYVKGKEYETNVDPRFLRERDAVERHGGRVVFSSGDVVFSSTALIGGLERSIDLYHARVHQLLRDPALSSDVINGLISSMRGKRVLVVGETIVDEYVHCDQPEIASESPVMTLRPIQRRTYDGGAAVIARHAAALGARPILLTALPDSPSSEALRRRLASEGVEVRSIPIESPIAIKQRFLIGPQKVMKLNLVEPIVLDAACQQELVALAGELAEGFDSAIVADFGNGLLSGSVVGRLCRELRPRVATLAGDVSGRQSGLLSFCDADLLCPSEREAREALRCFQESLPAVAWRLIEETRAKHVMLTMAAEGLIAFDPLKLTLDEQADDANRQRVRGQHVPALTGYPVDPLGCGDSLLTAAALSLAAGGSILSAAFIGSLAAAISAQRLGNVPVSASDLRQALARLSSSRLAMQAIAHDRHAAG